MITITDIIIIMIIITIAIITIAIITIAIITIAIITIAIITIAIITIAIITIAIITIAIITISPEWENTYIDNWWDGSILLHWKIWIGALLSPRSNCLHFLENLWLQLSTPWLWDMVRSCHSWCAKHTVLTMILTEVMTLATIHCLPPTARYPPHPTCHPLLKTCSTPHQSPPDDGVANLAFQLCI